MHPDTIFVQDICGIHGIKHLAATIVKYFEDSFIRYWKQEEQEEWSIMWFKSSLSKWVLCEFYICLKLYYPIQLLIVVYQNEPIVSIHAPFMQKG